jgi:hypothetical protein
MPRDGFVRSHPAAETVETAAPPPTLVAELGAGERLLLWTWRTWLDGLAKRDAERQERAWTNLSAMLGPAEARALLDAVSRLIYRCVHAARGEIVYHPNCCRRVAPDEYRLLGLVAACAAGDANTAEHHAAILLRGGATAGVRDAGTRLASALVAAGHTLPHRPADARSDALVRAADALASLGTGQGDGPAH